MISRYNLNSKDKGPRITISSKNKGGSSLEGNYNPGPGNYDPNSNALYKSQSGITMGFRSNDDKNVMNNPGPGSYNISSSKGIKRGGKIGSSKRANFGIGTI